MRRKSCGFHPFQGYAGLASADMAARPAHHKIAVKNRQKRPFSEDVRDWLPLGWLRDLHFFFVLGSISKKFDWKL
jgi:hypothetical protein